MTYEGKTILVTGASSGIGEQMVKLLAKLNAKKIIIAARRVQELERVKKECGDTKSEIVIWPIDLSKPSKCFEEATAYAQSLGCLDILINNGGVSQRAQFKDFDFAQSNPTLQSNSR